MNLVFLVIGWVLYFFVHSLLADNNVKEWMSSKIGEKNKYYRLLYVIISVLGLLPLFYLNSNIDSTNYIDNSGVVRYLSLMSAAFGVIIVKVAFRSYNFSSFIGILPEEGQPLITTGLLGSVRHPIYSGTILIVIGYWLYNPDLPTLISAVCIFSYLPIGIYLEERKLLKLFGVQYMDYKKKVPAVFPRLF
jgi:protein-S-isoprenylcysteine O-methyltransferase Ste14